MLTVLWRDFFAAIAAVFIALTMLMVVFINDPTRSKEEEAKVIGSLMVTAVWPSNLPVDIDLWVSCGREQPIGYSRRSGVSCSYLRDDLGSVSDPTPANFEVVASRGVPQGETCINVHYYAGIVPDVPVDFDVTLNDGTGGMRHIASTKVVLPGKGTERTAMCFTIKGTRIVGGSFHNRFRPLRSAAAGSH